MEWWENTWVIVGLIVLAAFLFIQRDMDIFNLFVRQIFNVVIYDFNAVGLLFWVVIAGLFIYIWNKRKS